ncbi:MAG: zinc-binding dehydrogenase [Gemmatimonadota bacterium]|nr:zinc-binding dehydrogenase [Gemmatimonadota bacterium]
MMPQTMRAAVFSEFGGPEVVKVRDDVAVPDPAPGEVRLQVEAAAMNHLDLWVRRGLPIETPMPHIGGSDIVGTVESVGAGVEGVPLGTRVVVDPSVGYQWYEAEDRGESILESAFHILGEHTQGGFAEYVVVPAANLLEIPEGVPSAKAAAAGLSFVTAWRALITRGALRAGERVLVTGASGGVGTASVSIAVAAGAEVYAVTSGTENVERIEAMGAHRVYDRTDVDFSREVWRETGKRGVHLVYDTAGEAVWEQCLRSLAVGGRLVTSGATTGPKGVSDIRLIFWKQLSILGSTMGTPGEFRRVMRMVFSGALQPVIHETLPLAEARRAHELLEGGGVFGKIVLEP